jgi:ATP-dependent Clp protease ATP-binding subunit ClpC
MRSANQEAIRLQHRTIGAQHLLLALLKLESGVVADVLKHFEIDTCELRAELLDSVPKRPDPVKLKRLPPDARAKKAIELAIGESYAVDYSCAGPEHILLGLLLETESLSGQVLKKRGLTPERVRGQIDRARTRASYRP